MQNEKHESTKEEIGGDANVQGSAPVQSSLPPEKVSISFHKFTVVVLKETLKDLQTVMGDSKCSMKQAVSLFVDLGALSFKKMKIEMKKLLELKMREVEEQEKKEKECLTTLKD